MEIESVGFSSYQDYSEYLTSEEEIEMSSPALDSSASEASLERMATETAIVRFQMTQEELEEKIEKAWKAHRYTEILHLIGNVDENQLTQELVGIFKVAQPFVSSMCLEMLGRSEEALQSINQALVNVEGLKAELKGQLLDEAKKIPGIPAEFIPLLIEQLETNLNDEFDSMKASMLMQRAFILLSLGEREAAILDFQEAFLNEDDFDSIFFGKVLEKKLGVSLLTVTQTLEGSDYEEILGYAMLEQFDQAFECYESMEIDASNSNFSIPLLLYSLKGDSEMAEKEIKNWPELDPIYEFYLKAL